MKRNKGIITTIISTMALAVILTSALFATGCSASADTSTPTNASSDLSGNVKTGGSTSVEKVMNALIYQFQDENREVVIDYELNGSGDGIKNTTSGLYEIGHSSRELKTDGSESGLVATAYAIDGIAIVVNPENGVENLTNEQLKNIYTGKTKNWKELGGKDAQITVVTREEGSGTRSAFAEIVGIETKDSNDKADPKTAIVAKATVASNTGAIQTTVSQNPNAIGYMSFSDVDDTKVRTVKYEKVEISEAALTDGTYKLKRDFYLITKEGATLSPAAQAFVDFVLSPAGEQIIASNKLLPIK
jgi:phosphate transport system substrate-binding protein